MPVVLWPKIGEEVVLDFHGHLAHVVVTDIGRGKVCLQIEAPASVKIDHRLASGQAVGDDGDDGNRASRFFG
jgi:sRNA-binding carbon storage regulator CsrA